MNGDQIRSIVKFTEGNITVEILLSAPNPDYRTKVNDLLRLLVDKIHSFLGKEEQ